MRASRLHPVAVVLVVAFLGSGCALGELKRTNQRLQESNDRLVSENNRLEHELAAAQQELEAVRSQLALAPPAPATQASHDPGNLKPSRDQVARDLILEQLGDMPSGVQVEHSSQGVHVRIPDRVFFALGQAKLSQQGQQVLEGIARVLNKEYAGHLVRVDGHTDDIPIRKVRHLYPTNWELSTARACTVVRYLVDRGGVDAQRIYPAGFSYYRPLSHSKTAAARQKNRRVEITILDQRA